MPRTPSSHIYEQYSTNPDSPRNRLEVVMAAAQEIFTAYNTIIKAINYANPDHPAAALVEITTAARLTVVQPETINHLAEVRAWLQATRRHYERMQRHLYRKNNGLPPVNKPYAPRRNPTAPRQFRAPTDYSYLQSTADELNTAGVTPPGESLFAAPIERILDGSPPPESEFDPSQPIDTSLPLAPKPKLSLDDLAAIERASANYDKDHNS